MIVESVTSNELIENLEVNPSHLTPNFATFIYKNRLGTKGVVIWSKTDLSTLTTKPLFVTNYNYERIDIPKTRIILGEDNKFTVDEDKKIVF